MSMDQIAWQRKIIREEIGADVLVRSDKVPTGRIGERLHDFSKREERSSEKDDGIQHLSGISDEV
jgi:hypothetical protein